MRFDCFLIHNLDHCNFVYICLFFTFTIEVLPANGHVGEPCKIFGICWPPNIHIYCDENNICQCRPETPVKVGDHSCKRNKSFGDKCIKHDECLYSDDKSYCENGSCNCVGNYTYDTIEMKCVHSTEHHASLSSVLYMILSSTALWLILLLITLFVTIPCCLAFIYHCVCYDCTNDPIGTSSSICRDSSTRRRFNETGEESVRESLRQEDLVSRQSSYELGSHDEPPPPYEEAIKNCPAAASIWIPEVPTAVKQEEL